MKFILNAMGIYCALSTMMSGALLMSGTIPGYTGTYEPHDIVIGAITFIAGTGLIYKIGTGS